MAAESELFALFLGWSNRDLRLTLPPIKRDGRRDAAACEGVFQVLGHEKYSCARWSVVAQKLPTLYVG